MKKLQNNFTTPDQSKRLLELGVPADSADCFIFINSVGQDIGILDFPYSEVEKEGFCPCWSVGRLIEIFIICTPYVEIRLRTRLIDQLIASYEDVVKQSLIDFSKLEE